MQRTAQEKVTYLPDSEDELEEDAGMVDGTPPYDLYEFHKNFAAQCLYWSTMDRPRMMMVVVVVQLIWGLKCQRVD